MNEKYNDIRKKIIEELVRKASEKKLNSSDLKDAYEKLNMDFEDASQVAPRYIQTIYLYINGSTKDAYDLVLN